MTWNWATVVILVWLHFFADFVLQTDKMAINKSKSIKWLLIHIGMYTIPLFTLGWKFALLNGVLHLTVDFFSSKITSTLWAKEERHWFFVTIGADQAVHITCLVLTANYLQVF